MTELTKEIIKNKLKIMLKDDILFHSYRGKEYEIARYTAESLYAFLKGEPHNDLCAEDISIYLERRYSPFLTKEEVEEVNAIV